MVNDLLITTKTDKEHLAEVFALVNGFSVKDEQQLYHPSTQLRPAVDPAKTHWREDSNTKNPPRKAEVSPEDRYVGECSQKPNCARLSGLGVRGLRCLHHLRCNGDSLLPLWRVLVIDEGVAIFFFCVEHTYLSSSSSFLIVRFLLHSP
jgi:hypothetical protein